MTSYTTASRVEEIALERSGEPLLYPSVEKIGVLAVPDFPTLGKLTALRFLEWLQLNPEGVISLPTGKAAEQFVTWTSHFLRRWDDAEVQGELGEWGLDPARKPDMRSFPFVQIDEFYPMDPSHESSYAHYIARFYFSELGLDRGRALLMDAWRIGAPPGKDLGAVFPGGKVDLSLRVRAPRNELERQQAEAIAAADQFAMDYEARIEALGGIGFFVSGIGPDGHIGFNIRGSDHFSTTRLLPINFEAAAAAAPDLGGIEVTRHKGVLTIGLRTVTQNPDVTALIIAAGETRAGVVRDAVEGSPSIRYPATALHRCTGARFYVTSGAASGLTQRRRKRLQAMPALPESEQARILVDVATECRKRLVDLDGADLAMNQFADFLPADDRLNTVTARISSTVEQRIERGIEALEGLTFLHTGPHHDDIMLGYLPYIVHLVRSARNTHYYATLTSGFTSVTDAYLLSHLENLKRHLTAGILENLVAEGYHFPDNVTGRNRDVYQYLDGVAARSPEMQREAEARRMLRNLVALTERSSMDEVTRQIGEIERYLGGSYPGQKQTPQVQSLKGMIREWEEELLWAHLGFSCDHVFHLRLGFYSGDLMASQPEQERDVTPIIRLLEEVNPDVVSVALDPEGAGPDTHYKALQALSAALEAYLTDHPEKKIQVWGYRNVWDRFHPADANIYVPVSMNSMAILHQAFHTCFGSQRSASFPSPEYDGPFCDLAQKIMVEQYAILKTCLGRDFFYANPIPRLRASRGFCFLRAMAPEELFREARKLRSVTEAG